MPSIRAMTPETLPTPRDISPLLLIRPATSCASSRISRMLSRACSFMCSPQRYSEPSGCGFVYGRVVPLLLEFEMVEIVCTECGRPLSRGADASAYSSQTRAGRGRQPDGADLMARPGRMGTIG